MSSLVETIRRLLQPTYDEQGWYQEVMSLDKTKTIPILVNIVRDEHESLDARRQAVFILGLLGDARPTDTLFQTLNEDDRTLRAYAAEALGKIAGLSSDQVHRLITTLQDEDGFVRERTAKALKQLQRPEALPALREMRATDSVAVNREVADEAIKSIEGTA